MTVDAAQYTIGTEVRCGDTACGTVERVVVDPVARKLTHLVVDPGKAPNRLVPIELVDPARTATDGDGSGGSGSDDSIQLLCSEAEFEALPAAEVTEFLPGTDEGFGYRPDQMIIWPYYGMGAGAVGTGGAAAVLATGGEPEPRTTTYDRVPSGEVQIRRGEKVEATDGDIGRVQGLVIDPQDHAVTHVLLQEGHLWGKKTVAIPIRAVTYVGGDVRVQLTKAELGDLPPVDLAELSPTREPRP